jgi:signal transduction histidine kinase
MGLCRFANGSFIPPSADSPRGATTVRSMLEDREGNLWMGRNSGLERVSDAEFITYGRPEGLPSDEPTAVYQARDGQMWIGFRDRGLVAFSAGKSHSYTTRDGLPSNQIFAIRETAKGDLLIANQHGLTRMHGGHFITYSVEDSLKRTSVFDTLEASNGWMLAAHSGGVSVVSKQDKQLILPAGPQTIYVPLALRETRDGSLWIGTYGNGLWQIPDLQRSPFVAKHYTVKEGLASNQIRSLLEDADGTLWIGTFGGGLNSYHNGQFRKYGARDGLLGDNISDVEDDNRGDLWLSTTRGICRISKQQLRDFDTRAISTLASTNYNVADGLRSSQCAPGFVQRGGGTRTRDGRLWFPTSVGVSVIDPNSPKQSRQQPVVQLLEVSADGRTLDLDQPIRLNPGTGNVNFHFAAIHLRAPETVRYAYKLEGLDQDWIPAASRLANYNSLPNGEHRFFVRAVVPGEPASEASLRFEVLPRFYKTVWFVCLCIVSLAAIVYGVHQLRLQQMRARFSLMLQERARLARDIHDTLAQGFVGISSQLDALSLKIEVNPIAARQHLDMARKMARHSLVEARRSVMNLRTAVLDNQDISSAFGSAMRHCVGDSGVELKVKVSGVDRKVRDEIQENLLRIAQEAVTNAIQHAQPKSIRVELEIDSRRIRLSVIDDGRGFQPSGSFSPSAGHFGIVGMRERAERIGGELRLTSKPSEGTKVEIEAPTA